MNKQEIQEIIDRGGYIYYDFGGFGRARVIFKPTSVTDDTVYFKDGDIDINIPVIGYAKIYKYSIPASFREATQEEIKKYVK